MPACPYCAEPLKQKPIAADHAVLAACLRCMNPFTLQPDGATWRSSPVKGGHDFRQAAQEGSIAAELMKLVPEAVEQLPVLPEIAHRVMAMVHDPDAVIDDLAKAISQDQIIAMKVLRLANSAMYAGLTEIKDLQAACIRLGMKNIANVVQAVAGGRMYATQDAAYRKMMEDLWRHALASAHCASEVATLLAQPRSDVFFVAGLVHDIGKVLLLDLAANPALRRNAPVLEGVRQSPQLLEEVMGAYHCLLGLHIVQHWNLPPDFGVAVFCHEDPESVPDDAWLILAHAVALASAVADASGFGLTTAPPSLLSFPSTKFLGLSDTKLAALRVNLEDRIEPLLKVLAG